MTARKSRLNRAIWSDHVILGALCLFALLIIFPFLNALAISFMTETEYVLNKLALIPREPTVAAYRQIWDQGWLGLGYRNSLIISGGGWLYVLFVTVVTSYAITRSFPGKRVFLLFLIIPMFFTGGLLPTYLQITKTLNLKDTYWAVILPAGVSTYYMLIMSSFFRSIPASLEESARLDGASEARILWSIILPLSKSILATISLFVIVGFWNEWFSPMLYIQKAKMLPLQLYLRNIVDTTRTSADRGVTAQQQQVYADAVRMAAVVLTMLPIMVVYPFLQKYFVKGVMIGAVKG